MRNSILPLEIIAYSSFFDVPTSLRNGAGPLPCYIAALFRGELIEPIDLVEISARYAQPMVDDVPPSSKVHTQSEFVVEHFQVPIKLGFWERFDTKREKSAAIGLLHRMGYVVKGNEIYYPKEIRINGKLVQRNEELVGRLLFDGYSNRAEFLRRHCYKVEGRLREIGYVSVAPIDKI